MMRATRRAWLGGAAVAAIGGLPKVAAAAGTVASLSRDDFDLGEGTYLNSGGNHPLSRPAAAAMRAFVDGRAGGARASNPYGDPRAQFARLINAKPSEVALIAATAAGENLIVQGLGLLDGNGRVVTDGGHFMGSLYMYEALAKRGLDVRRVAVRTDGTVSLDDIAAHVSRGVGLIAVSLVSMTTGFQYDLKALCDLAHAHGAWVHVDAIQAVGAIPVDVRASGVDSLAAGGYKWLMGESGVAFLYVRDDRLERLQRPVFGFGQLEFDMAHLPFDPVPPGGGFRERSGARGRFELGGESGLVLRAVQDSMARIEHMGVEAIAAHRRPLLSRLRSRLVDRGYRALSPNGDGPLACFAFENASARLTAKLRAARIEIAIYQNRIRVSPSIFNTMDDVERLLEVLEA